MVVSSARCEEMQWVRRDRGKAHALDAKLHETRR